MEITVGSMTIVADVSRSERVPKSAGILMIGSTEAFSGKSATVLGIAHQLKKRGIEIAYGKPLGTCWHGTQSAGIEEDVKFVADTLAMPENRIQPTVLFLDEPTIQRRLQGQDPTDYAQRLREAVQPNGADLVLLEGPANLTEGSLFQLSMADMVDLLDARVLLVARFQSLLSIGGVMAAYKQLGDRLLGVVINDIPPERMAEVENTVRPFLNQQGLPVFGLIPRNALLWSVSVGELVEQLGAEVLCCPERLDLLVETLRIGAMNVNSALKYFRKGENMAVVTGGDRTDIQIAALETSTHCLILTGHMPPSPDVIARAEDMEIPILSVDLDTLTTVEIIDQAFGKVRVHEPVKVECIHQLMSDHFDMERLISELNLQPAVSAR